MQGISLTILKTGSLSLKKSSSTLNKTPHSHQALFDTIVILFAAAIAGFFVYYPITDSDIFWHLASGREILRARNFLYSDPFSFTTPGIRWIDVHWLFQVYSFAMHSIGGFTSLLFSKAIFFAISTAILMHLFKLKKFYLFSFLLLILCILFRLRYLVTLRPILFSLLFLSMYFLLLENFCKTGKFRYLVFLIPIQIAWVNSQGLFMIGPFIFLCYLAGESLNATLQRRLPAVFKYRPQIKKQTILYAGSIFLLLAAASLVSPYGFTALKFPFLLLGRISPSLKNIYSQNIIENTPLLMMLGTEYAHYVYTFIIISCAAMVTALMAQGWIRFSHLIILTGFLVPAYMAQRNLILYAFAAIPFIQWNMGHIKLPFSKTRTVKYAAYLVTLVLLLWAIGSGVSHFNMLSLHSSPTAPFSHPEKSVQYLQRNNIEGNVFNADRYGGYLLWKMYPQKKVFIDTRLTMRSREFFAEYLQILRNPELFNSVKAKFGITHVVLPTANTDLYFKLIRYLYKNSQWNMVYTDGAEVLFVLDSLSASHKLLLNSTITVDSISEAIIGNMPTETRIFDESIFHFGNLLAEIGELSNAKRVLSRSQWLECDILRAKVEHKQGNSVNAILMLEKLKKRAPGNLGVRFQLASLYVEQKNYKYVLENLRYILKKDPFNKDARVLFEELNP